MKSELLAQFMEIHLPCTSKRKIFSNQTTLAKTRENENINVYRGCLHHQHQFRN
jgi:hypothetical protein